MRPIRQAFGSTVIDPALLTCAERNEYDGFVRRQDMAKLMTSWVSPLAELTCSVVAVTCVKLAQCPAVPLPENFIRSPASAPLPAKSGTVSPFASARSNRKGIVEATPHSILSRPAIERAIPRTAAGAESDIESRHPAAWSRGVTGPSAALPLKMLGR